MTDTGAPHARSGDRQAMAVAAIVVVQAVAAAFFVADAIGDIAAGDTGPHIAIEAVIAFALLAGVAFGTWQTRRMLAEAKHREAALAVAQGAVADLIQLRFRDWGLTGAEADVALFALKGCEVSEIARLRDVAEGTVRAQLTSIYAKAGVSSRSALLSLFFEDLIDSTAP
jgi:DNA-binding CsgD family transcriptional regulator